MARTRFLVFKTRATGIRRAKRYLARSPEAVNSLSRDEARS
jgi:hypothetical protein